MEFGKKIQLLRKENKMSQEKLAEQIHVSRQAISKWEQGMAVPDTDNIVQLSKFFQVPVEFLLFEEYDSVEQLMPVQPQNIQNQRMNKVKQYIIWVIIGIVIEIIAICSTYIIQYLDMEMNDSCYTNALNYLMDFPLILILFAGFACILWGGVGIRKCVK